MAPLPKDYIAAHLLIVYRMGNQKDRKINIMAKIKTKGQTMIYKILHRKLKIEQH
jgi:hypothetical protein